MFDSLPKQYSRIGIIQMKIFSAAKGLSPAMAFVAFLMRHICGIRYSAIYLVYDNRSTLEGNVISSYLNSIPIPITCYYRFASYQRSVTDFIQQPLIISLVEEIRLLQIYQTNYGDMYNSLYGLWKNTFIFVVPVFKLN